MEGLPGFLFSACCEQATCLRLFYRSRDVFIAWRARVVVYALLPSVNFAVRFLLGETSFSVVLVT